MKHRHPSFGPKKIRDRLRAVVPEEAWPVDSTVGVILKRAGLVRPRRVRRRRHWSADFKGDFPVGNGQRCYPLTDNDSRYLLHCQGLLHPTTAAVQPWFVWVFREYGLPETMRTDNGPPFASTALGGLSRLAAWWVRLGIRPERIRPGTPSENGRHERMHRALNAAVDRPPAMLGAQQRRFTAVCAGIELGAFPRSAGAPHAGQCASAVAPTVSREAVADRVRPGDACPAGAPQRRSQMAGPPAVPVGGVSARAGGVYADWGEHLGGA